CVCERGGSGDADLRAAANSGKAQNQQAPHTRLSRVGSEELPHSHPGAALADALDISTSPGARTIRNCRLIPARARARSARIAMGISCGEIGTVSEHAHPRASTIMPEEDRAELRKMKRTGEKRACTVQGRSAPALLSGVPKEIKD